MAAVTNIPPPAPTPSTSTRRGLDLRQASFPVRAIVADRDVVLYPITNNQRVAPWFCDVCQEPSSSGRRFAAQSEDIDVCEKCATSDTRTCDDMLSVVEREIESLTRIRDKLLATQNPDQAAVEAGSVGRK